MSRFYGSMKGQAGETTRMGSARSGLSAHVRGWDLGARAGMWADNDRDTVNVVLTSGSNGYGRSLAVFEAEQTDEGVKITLADELGGGVFILTREGLRPETKVAS